MREPLIDEQQLEEMNDIVGESMEFSFPVSILYKNKRLVTVNDMVHYVDRVQLQSVSRQLIN
ncbi:YolD-like family protein [Metabacillus dongyingensis]|uniref:YolD-like family protein n=1 Tax=Metabacillus dongyingensis TaxID=2874282 RepID=UPI003B8C4723